MKTASRICLTCSTSTVHVRFGFYGFSVQLGIFNLLPGYLLHFGSRCQAKITVSSPGAMLNALVNRSFTKDEYHTLLSDGSYAISTENSIFFEVDGPYQLIYGIACIERRRQETVCRIQP